MYCINYITSINYTTSILLHELYRDFYYDLMMLRNLLHKEGSGECPGIMRNISSNDMYSDTVEITDEETVVSFPPKLYSMKTIKGMEQFKASLAGLAGEKKWNLWLDIEKMKLTKDQTLLDQ